jgi:hypothetical protein
MADPRFGVNADPSVDSAHRVRAVAARRLAGYSSTVKSTATSGVATATVP